MSPDDTNATSALTSFQIDPIESVRLQCGSFVARLQSHVSIENVRPLPEFLGLQSAPKNIQYSPDECMTTSMTSGGKINAMCAKVQKRIRQNFTYFLSNYAIVAAMTALTVLVLHPSVIFMFFFLTALWWCHGYMIRHELVVASVRIHAIFSVQQRFYILFCLSWFLIIITCVMPTLWFLLISSFIILFHATVRDTSYLPVEEQNDLESPLLNGKSNSQEAEQDPLLESP